MVGFIIFIFILIWFIVIVPLYKAIRKQQAAKRLNMELDRLAQIYEYTMATYSFRLADSCLDQAREAIREFTADIRLSPQELAQIAPSVTRFPNWQSWI